MRGRTTQIYIYYVGILYIVECETVEGRSANCFRANCFSEGKVGQPSIAGFMSVSWGCYSTLSQRYIIYDAMTLPHSHSHKLFAALG